MKRTFTFVVLLIFSILFIPGICRAQVSNFNTLSSKSGKINEIALRDKQPALDDTGIDVFIFGNGGLRNAIMNPAEGNNPINGSLGTTFKTFNMLELTAGFTINDFTNPIINSPAAYGKSMLTPDVSGQSFTLNVKKRFLGIEKVRQLDDHMFLKNSGCEFTMIIAPNQWQLNDSTFRKATPLSFNLNYFWDPFGIIPKGNNLIYFELALGATVKAVIGDITHSADEMKKYFSTKQTWFAGPEASARLIINGQMVFINVPVIFSTPRVEGLTGPQVIIGVTLNADLIKL